MITDFINFENLAQEEKIALEIYRYNYDIKESIYFSKLTEIFDGRISRATISKIIDKLFDLCMIYAEWEEVDSKWVRSLHISEGEYKKYFEMLYNIIGNV